jgi:hypothetical protein
MYSSVTNRRRELWRQKYPAIIGALLSVFQMILTMVILGCEIGGDFIHFPRMNAFVGYWVFPLFMCAWLSLAGASIYSYLINQNCLLMLFSVRLLLSNSMLRNYNTHFSMFCNSNGIMCYCF